MRLKTLNIIEIAIEEIKPYENNPRNNDEAVEPVANSIKEFGFKVPIIIDKDNVIVAGHTRYKAAKLLELDKIPCIKADDLTEEQIKAFRLADNKVSEIATWDYELLDLELDSITDIDMSMFDFDIEEEPNTDELERDTEENEKFIVKITFDTYNDWLDKEDDLRQLVDGANANMVVGSV